MNLHIINGTLCNAQLWDPVINTVSTKLPITVSFPDISDGQSIDAYAQATAHTLSTQHDWVLGYSLGGIVALELAKKFQHRLQGVILVCTNYRGQDAEKERAIQTQLALLAADGLSTVFDAVLLPAYFGDALSSYGKEARMIKDAGLAFGEEVYQNQLNTLRTRMDQSPFLAQITVPTLIVCGAQDRLCPPSLHREMHALFPNSTLYEMQDVGHMLPLLRGQELGTLVADFMEAHG